MLAKLLQFVESPVAVQLTSQACGTPSGRYQYWSLEYPRNVPALVLAAAFSMPDILRQMVAGGHAIDGTGSDGETALIRAAMFGHSNNVQTLRGLGADVNAMDYTGETAIHRAARNGLANVIKTLIAHSPDLSLKTSGRWTVLMSAVSSGSLEAVRILMEAGVDLAAETAWGDTALSIATRSGQEDIANLLADHGAILPRGAAGRRASLAASRRGYERLVRRLTANYDAVAARPLQRRRSARGELGGIQEEAAFAGQLPAGRAVEQTLIEPPAIDPNEGDISEFMEQTGCLVGFLTRYNLLQKMGKGHFAEVYLCSNKVTGLQYAVKVLPFRSGRTYLQGLHQEVVALRTTGARHPNIMRLIDTFFDHGSSSIFLVLELVPEGELFKFIVAKKKLTEDETRTIFSQLFSVLVFLHSEGWTHRDIKPENILLKDNKLGIKLVDFGLAKRLQTDPPQEVADLPTATSTLLGTPSYVAPEILADAGGRSYGVGVDVWSAGVVLYICLCGFPPFSDELYSRNFPYTLSQQIRSGRFDYPSPYWDSVGDPALDLIDSILVVDPAKRYTAAKCLEHPWMGADVGQVVEDAVRAESPEIVDMGDLYI